MVSVAALMILFGSLAIWALSRSQPKNENEESISQVVATPHATPARSGFGLSSIILLATIAGFLYFLFAAPAGFSESDIETARQKIRDEYAKRPGIEVLEVQLMRKAGDRSTLVGFVRVRGTGTSRELTQDCEALMGDKAEFIWRCK